MAPTMGILRPTVEDRTTEENEKKGLEVEEHKGGDTIFLCFLVMESF